VGALFLFFIAFAVFRLITVLFLQDLWHYSALRSGLAIAPGPLAPAAFVVNSGRIVARFGRTWPVVAGASSVVTASLFWLLAAPAHPAYVTGFVPGLMLVPKRGSRPGWRRGR
jgi:hypothetical protein